MPDLTAAQKKMLERLKTGESVTVGWGRAWWTGSKPREQTDIETVHTLFLMRLLQRITATKLGSVYTAAEKE